MNLPTGNIENTIGFSRYPYPAGMIFPIGEKAFPTGV